jgi:hypothetical protein
VRITPPPRPLGVFGFIRALLRNPMLVAPEPIYEHGVVRQSTPLGPIVWITEPAVIKSVLLDRCETFRMHSTSTTGVSGSAMADNQAAIARRADFQFHGSRSAILFAG